MSFYDDASLAFLPSGGAGKDGKAYSIKPVPEYSNELITNGGFDTDSDWTFTNVGGSNGWRIADGRAICDTVSPSSGRNLDSSISLVSGKSYKVTLDILQSADELEILVGSTLIQNAFTIGTTIGASYIIDSSQHSGGTFSLYGGSSDLQEIDNVSVKEVVVGDGDFTFSRGSNLTATRVDSNGLIEKGRENLLLQSNQFDTTWTGTSGVSVTSGQSGYDGSSDAWLLSKSVTEQYSRVQQNVNSSGIYTCSVYAKENTISIVGLRNGSSADRVLFDLSGSGSIDSQVGDIVHRKIQSVGNGWFRCEVTFSDALDQFQIYVDWSESTAGSIYIQDAQLEQGLVATEYIESGATKGKAGLLEQEPRFDYSGGASCPSLLLEPQRSNLVPISEGIPEDTIQVTLTENYGTSPEGVQNSLKVQKNGVSSSDRIFPIDNYNATLVSGTSYSVSAFVKNIDVNGTTTIGCRLGSGGTLFRLGYEWSGSSLAISSGYAAGTRTNEILEDYGNGWWRIGFSFEADNTQGGIELDIDRDNGSATTSIETYGWQLEAGSYPTSYIPNHSGGSVTRDADETQELIFDDDLTSVVLFGEITAPDVIRDSSQRLLEMGKSGTVHNAFYAYRNHSTNERRATFYIRNDSGTQTFIAEAQTDRVKFAMQYNAGNGSIKVYVNGSNALSSPITDTDYTEFEKFKLSGVGGVVRVHQFIALKATYTNAELAALTTL